MRLRITLKDLTHGMKFKMYLVLAKCTRQSQKVAAPLTSITLLTCADAEAFRLVHYERGGDKDGLGAVGEWVVVQYDGKNFLGEITHIKGADRRVSVMYNARRGKGKWPEKPDSIYYKPETILARIEPPVPVEVLLIVNAPPCCNTRDVTCVTNIKCCLMRMF